MCQGEHIEVIRVTKLGKTSLSFSSSCPNLPESEKELQTYLVSQKRLSVVLQVGTCFSEEEYNMGRPFNCLKLPDLKLPNKQKYSEQYWGTPAKCPTLSIVYLIQAYA